MKCKHQNGRLTEIMNATHERRVVGGIVEGEGLNEIGNVQRYEYRCSDCQRVWLLSTLEPDYTRIPKWLAKIVETFE